MQEDNQQKVIIAGQDMQQSKKERIHQEITNNEEI